MEKRSPKESGSGHNPKPPTLLVNGKSGTVRIGPGLNSNSNRSITERKEERDPHEAHMKHAVHNCGQALTGLANQMRHRVERLPPYFPKIVIKQVPPHKRHKLAKRTTFIFRLKARWHGTPSEHLEKNLIPAWENLQEQLWRTGLNLMVCKVSFTRLKPPYPLPNPKRTRQYDFSEEVNMDFERHLKQVLVEMTSRIGYFSHLPSPET